MRWTERDSTELRRRIKAWVEKYDNVDVRQRTLNAQLGRGTPQERELQSRLLSCTHRQPHTLGSCMECKSDFRYWTLPQIAVLLVEELVARAGARLCLISAVDYRDGRDRGALAGFDFKQMLASFSVQAKRIGLGRGPVCADTSFNRWRLDEPPPIWQPHVHGLFVTERTEAQIREGFGRSFPEGPGVSCPVDVEFVDDLDDLAAVITYCFKLETTERNPYLRPYWINGEWRQPRPNPRPWQRREHALALDMPVGDLVVLLGMKREWANGAVCVKRV